MWLTLAFLTALFTSLQDVFGKTIITRVNVYVIAWAWFFFTLPFVYAYLFVEGVPPLGAPFFTALAGSTVILIICSVCYFKAIKFSDLSVGMPMLAFTPVFLLLTSPLMVGEFPGPAGVIGIILIVAGAYVLNIHTKGKGYLEPFKCLFREKGARYMLLVAFLYSVGANFDKIGVVHSSPIMWIAALNTVLALAVGIIMFCKTRNVTAQVRSVWPTLVLIGLLNAIALIFQMVAIKMTLVAHLVAVKRTSVLMTSLFGIFLFKEKGMKERLLGALLMITGVFMISLFQ
jgi:uncharacterized membrane protein